MSCSPLIVRSPFILSLQVGQLYPDWTSTCRAFLHIPYSTEPFIPRSPYTTYIDGPQNNFLTVPEPEND